MSRRERLQRDYGGPSVEARFRQIERSPLPRNIGALLDEAARDVPDQPACVFIESGESLTYRTLKASVDKLAAGLERAGVRAGAHVGVMLPNVPEMPITWLALARIGAVMVPINVRYTASELDYTLADSNATFLIIGSSYLDILSAAQANPTGVFVVGSDTRGFAHWTQLLSEEGATGSGRAEPLLDDVVNIQYTSGTTGSPKGCVLTHRYWLVCARTYADCDAITYKRILAANPFFYMTPQWQLLMAFFHRGTLYVAPRLSATHFLRWARECRIEFCLVRNAYFREAPAVSDSSNDLVRVNIYERLKESHADLERRYDCAVRTAFGMTEIGAGMLTPFEADDMTGAGACGIAAPFRECRIADSEGVELPDGVSGELQIRGPGLFSGYYGKPEATALAFHGDWFRTGDVAYRDSRGYYYIAGRLKDMIKRAGENIAAAEVEAVLCEIPGVAEAAVVAVPDELRGEEVKAYVRLAEGVARASLPPERLIELCAERLAVFKIPRYIEYRDEPLPRTGSDKIKKQWLVQEKTDLTVGAWDRVERSWKQAC